MVVESKQPEVHRNADLDDGLAVFQRLRNLQSAQPRGDRSHDPVETLAINRVSQAQLVLRLDDSLAGVIPKADAKSPRKVAWLTVNFTPKDTTVEGRWDVELTDNVVPIDLQGLWPLQ